MRNWWRPSFWSWWWSQRVPIGAKVFAAFLGICLLAVGGWVAADALSEEPRTFLYTVERVVTRTREGKRVLVTMTDVITEKGDVVTHNGTITRSVVRTVPVPGKPGKTRVVTVPTTELVTSTETKTREHTTTRPGKTVNGPTTTVSSTVTQPVTQTQTEQHTDTVTRTQTVTTTSTVTNTITNTVTDTVTKEVTVTETVTDTVTVTENPLPPSPP